MKFSQWLSLIILMVCLYIIWQIRNVLLVGLTAIIVAVVLNRAVKFLQKWIASRKLAVLLISISVILILILFSLLLIPPFINQLQELINLVPLIIDRLQYSVNRWQQLAPFNLLPDGQGIGNLFVQLQAVNLEIFLSRFFRLFSNTLTLSLNILLVVVLSIMLLLNPQPYQNFFIRIFPASARPKVWQVMDSCEAALAGWSIGILFNMAAIALMSITGLWLIGLPLAFANGLLTGFLAFIPNIGLAISLIPPLAISLLGSPWQVFFVLALYILIQQVESNVLTPMVMQKQVSLLPAIMLLAQVVFAVFFGFLGLLLALPLTLIIQHWLKKFWVEDFLDQH